jgi:ketosteroid isomerase-like protein
MKRALAVASVMLAMSTVASAQSNIEKMLMDLEHQWVKAALAGKAEALAPVLAPTFVMVGTDGMMQNKDQYIAFTTKGKWQVSEVSDMKVQVYGDAAVVTGVWTGKGTDGAGKAFDGRERFADTWVKMADGKWQCVASASAPIK